MKLDKNTKAAVALDGTEYIPGYIGLNNIKHTDYLNVVVQVLYYLFKQWR
jgi:U4/U6.U5 tri-snRNP-associated protein 2